MLSKGTDSEQSSIEKADEAFVNNEYERAIEYYTQVLSEKPNDSAGYIGLVQSYAHLLKIDSMFTVITEALSDTLVGSADKIPGVDTDYFDILILQYGINTITEDYFDHISGDALYKLDGLLMDSVQYVSYRNSVKDSSEIALLKAKVSFITGLYDSKEKYDVGLELFPDKNEMEQIIGVGDEENGIYESLGDLERAKTDRVYRNSLNEKLIAAEQEMESMEIGSFLGDFAESDAADSSHNDFINMLVFYRLQDQKDNDGDGCVDEEIIDNKDNDGDGLVDEDVRLVELDLLDNDHNGSHESSTTNPDLREGLDPSGTYLLYLYDQLSPDYINDSFQGDSAQSVTYKRRVAYDSLKTIPLDTLKKNIGGCWNNYTER